MILRFSDRFMSRGVVRMSLRSPWLRGGRLPRVLTSSPFRCTVRCETDKFWRWVFLEYSENECKIVSVFQCPGTTRRFFPPPRQCDPGTFSLSVLEPIVGALDIVKGPSYEIKWKIKERKRIIPLSQIFVTWRMLNWYIELFTNVYICDTWYYV